MKLPVFRALGATFLFIGRNWLDILKIIWLPTVLFCGAYLLIMPGYMAKIAALQMDTPRTLEGAMSVWAVTLPPMLPLIIASVAFNLVLVTGLLRLVIRGERPKLPFYLGSGRDELRVLGGWGLLFAGCTGLFIAFGGALLLSRLLASMGPGPGGIIGLVAAVALIGVGVWLSMRVCLISAATIALNRIGLQASWDTTEENVWRLIGFWLLFAVAAFIISSLLTPFLAVPGYLDAMRDVYAAARSPTRMQAAIHHANEIMAAGFRLSDTKNVVRMLVNTVLGVAGSIFIAIASGVAWRLLTEEEQAGQA